MAVGGARSTTFLGVSAGHSLSREEDRERAKESV